MATQIDSVSIVGLRKAHINQLATYINQCGRDGWYYGHKDQFAKRHEDLVKWIDGLCEYVNKHDVRIKE